MKHWSDWIVADPAIMMGKPIIVGTRITVELIIEKLAAGETVEQIVEAHPRLNREAVRTALAFTSDVLRSVRGGRKHRLSYCPAPPSGRSFRLGGSGNGFGYPR